VHQRHVCTRHQRRERRLAAFEQTDAAAKRDFVRVALLGEAPAAIAGRGLGERSRGIASDVFHRQREHGALQPRAHCVQIQAHAPERAPRVPEHRVSRAESRAAG
jgi:hypothetical protein